jgi:Ran GTPase-activating protein (RanGAP) involved in mRNA processing and transport
MSKLIPLQDFVDKKSIIRNRIDRIRNELCYEKEAAPLDEILTQEFSTLRVLIVDSSIKDFSMVNSFRSYVSNSLEILSVSTLYSYAEENGLSNQDIFSICKAQIPNLVEFKACYNHITDEGAEYISQANWPKLGYFNLHSNQITTRGADKLLKRYSPNLFRFDLDYNNITDDLYGLVSSLAWPKLTEVHLGKLSYLILDGNQLADKNRKSLEQWFRQKWNVQKLFILSTY